MYVDLNSGKNTVKDTTSITSATSLMGVLHARIWSRDIARHAWIPLCTSLKSGAFQLEGPHFSKRWHSGIHVPCDVATRSSRVIPIKSLRT